MEIDGGRERGGNRAMRSGWIASAASPTRLSDHYRHSFDVPGHRDQRPLATYRSQPTQQKLSKAHGRFDDAEHRLHSLLAQGIELPSRARLQAMLHLLHGAGRFGQRRRLAEALRPVRVMTIASGGEQRCDLRRHALLDVSRAEIAIV